MSDKTVDAKQKKSFSKVFKWGTIILSVCVLEVVGVAASVYISEQQQKTEEPSLANVLKTINEQGNRLNSLEKLNISVSDNTQQLNAAKRTINLLSDNLNALTEEIAGYNLNTYEQKFADINHKIEVLEERSSVDALTLSVALIIKENALYHRPFASEFDILEDLAKDNPSIQKDIEMMKHYKTANIADNKELADEYNKFLPNLEFAQDNVAQLNNAEKETTISKGMKLIKKTVSNMNFDKVVILKKQKKTAEEKQMLANLTMLVNNYEYQAALNFINENDIFKKINNEAFNDWQNKVRAMLIFEASLSHIIAAEFDALRQDIKDKNIIHNTEKATISLEQTKQEQNDDSKID